MLTYTHNEILLDGFLIIFFNNKFFLRYIRLLSIVVHAIETEMEI